MIVFRAVACAAAAALVIPAAAWAHAHVSPPVVKTHAGQEFALTVPTEKDKATTTKVELTPPAGFAIDSFAPSPGWSRGLTTEGSGDAAIVKKVIWSGGSVPAGEY